MKFLRRTVLILSWMGVATILRSASVSAQTTNSVKMTPSELVRLEPEDVPEKVHLTEVKSSYSGYDLVTPVDIEAYILDTIPRYWVCEGGGKLTVSSERSGAGLKSIRWDWVKGSVLRIKNLGMMTHSEITNQDGRGLGNGEAYRPPFSLAGYQEAKAQENMAFHLYYQRIHKEHKHGEFEPVKMQLRQYANPVNFWFDLSGVAFDKQERRFYNQEVLREMPTGVPEPEINELIIQAPSDVASGTLFLDRLLVAASKVSNLKSNLCLAQELICEMRRYFRVSVTFCDILCQLDSSLQLRVGNGRI